MVNQKLVWGELDPQGRFWVKGEAYRVAIGAGGVRPLKQEGDLATPVAEMPVRRVFYRADRIPKPRAAVPVIALAPDDGWCDDPSSEFYNCQVRLPHAARHEVLWREDFVYDLLAVLGWNDAPAVPGKGSAIFLHVARPDFRPTEGCVALAQADLQRVLALGLTGVRVLNGAVSG